jgi:hypothetical protein
LNRCRCSRDRGDLKKELVAVKSQVTAIKEKFTETGLG